MKKWYNCYEGGWQGIIVPEAFSHPAKMAYGLLKRILSHAKEQGWLKEGDVIVDPFGGIGSTGILGAYEGYQCVLCESVGFETVCIHHAMLVKETSQETLFGDTEVKRKERKSFFRRLAESKGSPRIDFEVVLCMEKVK